MTKRAPRSKAGVLRNRSPAIERGSKYAAVYSPSDVAERVPAKPFLVGGRVVFVSKKRLRLVDALGGLELRLEDEALPSPGELVVLAVERAGARELVARLVERHVAPEPRGDGEFARFTAGLVGRNLEARSRAMSVIRSYFALERFVEVETPLRMRVPALDPHIQALRADGGYLVTSPELHMKRLLVGGLPRIFQLARSVRAEELGPWHEPEFTLLEWYRAFAPPEVMMRDTEELVRRVVLELGGSHQIVRAGRRIDVSAPFERLTIRTIFRRYAGVADALDLALSDEDRYFQLWVDSVEPKLGRKRRPFFLEGFPIAQTTFAQAGEDAREARRFELYVAGVELCNGYAELTDAREQEQRFRAERRRRRARGEPLYRIDQRFIAALKEGMPPAAGNALGLERLLALALGVPSIQSLQAFPEAWR